MPTNREAYFEAIKLGVPKPVVDFALCEINDFDYYNKTYQIERHDFIEFLCELSRMSNVRIMGLIQNLLVKVKENLYNV